jgi:hypothetical protein
MNTSKGTGAVEAVIQADLVYARVSGTSLRLDLYTRSGPPSDSCDSMVRGFCQPRAARRLNGEGLSRDQGNGRRPG